MRTSCNGSSSDERAPRRRALRRLRARGRRPAGEVAAGQPARGRSRRRRGAGRSGRRGHRGRTDRPRRGEAAPCARQAVAAVGAAALRDASRVPPACAGRVRRRPAPDAGRTRRRPRGATASGERQARTEGAFRIRRNIVLQRPRAGTLYSLGGPFRRPRRLRTMPPSCRTPTPRVRRVRTAPAGDAAASRRRMYWLLGLTFLHVFGEGGLALYEAVRTGSLALLAFGIESVIEGGAAFLAVRHLRAPRRRGGGPRAARLPARALDRRLVPPARGLHGRTRDLRALAGSRAEKSVLGLLLTIFATFGMPFVGYFKCKTSRRLGSKGLAAEAKESIACSIDSGLTMLAMIGGLLGAPGGWIPRSLAADGAVVPAGGPRARARPGPCPRPVGAGRDRAVSGGGC